MQQLIEFVKKIGLNVLTPVEREVFNARVERRLTWGQVREVTGLVEQQSRRVLTTAQQRLRAIEWVMAEISKEVESQRICLHPELFSKATMDFLEVGFPDRAIRFFKRNGYRTLFQIVAAIRSGDLFSNCETGYNSHMHYAVVKALGGKFINGKPHLPKTEDLPIYRLAMSQENKDPILRLIPKMSFPNKPLDETSPAEESNSHNQEENQSTADSGEETCQKEDSAGIPESWPSNKLPEFLSSDASKTTGTDEPKLIVAPPEAPQTIVHTFLETGQIFSQDNQLPKSWSSIY